MLIRKAEAGDIQAVSRIDNLSFPDGWSADYYSDERSNPIATLLVASSESSIMGFLLYWNIPPEMELLRMAVTTGMRGSGVGGRLLDHMMSTAQTGKTERIFLEVRRSNIIARHLYASRGFLETGIRREYYPHPREDAIRMEWRMLTARKNQDLP